MTNPAMALVITSINSPNEALCGLAEGATRAGWRFFVAGDTKSPADFDLSGCEFLSVDRQLSLGFRIAEICPTQHYARKNIGYLRAISTGAEIIVETDDDNLPYSEFFDTRNRHVPTRMVDQPGWVNIYRYFTDANIWPRGLPLDHIHDGLQTYESLTDIQLDCPIQQGLANLNPDVDAIYRLTLPLPQEFRRDRSVAITEGAWSPFCSQNTTWWADTFPLLYLPAYCTFRMTDIWRSFVAQKIAWRCGWNVLFHGPTMWQDRNDHNLMQDFSDEIPGYLNNNAIRTAFDKLHLAPGIEAIPANMRLCYQTLCDMDLVGYEELPLLDAWLEDLASLK